MVETIQNKDFIYTFGKFALDPQEKTLFAEGRALHLPAKEFETLLLLVENNGRALAKDEMVASLWPDAFVEESNLAKQISRLRKILDANGEKFIETLPKHGYRFSAEVSQSPRPSVETILEKRTVKRLTVRVENEIEEAPAAPVPAARRGRRLAPWIALALVAAAAASFFLWRRAGALGPVPENVEKSVRAPVRLTDGPHGDAGPVWMKDGRIRFLRLDEKGRAESWIMNADGTGQTPVRDFDGLKFGRWSPDGKKVIYPKPDEKNVFLLADADGSNATLVPYDGSNLDWSADSRQLVYQKNVRPGNADIFVYSIDTGENRNLTNSPNFEADPAVSPDGRQVAFVSDRDGNLEIYAMNIDGGPVRRLTNSPSIEGHPAFSPDGTQLLFTSDRDRENSDVFIINADGGEPRNLTNWEKSDEVAGPGSWSPDGTAVAFVSNRSGKDEIYVMSAEVFEPRLVLGDAERDLGFPGYAPDGRRLVYEAENSDQTGELRILDLETGESVRVVKTEIATTLPMWSPDGEWIVYQDRIGGNTEICRIRPDGRDFQNLTNDPARDGEPAWSPDGRRIVFASNRGENSGNVRLYAMNADGSDQHPIYSGGDYSSGPVWSPDGATLAFASDKEDFRTGNFEIFSIRPGTNEPEKRLTYRRRSDSQPAFSPDGRLIAFTAAADGSTEIYVMNADGGAPLRITRNAAEDSGPRWSPDGRRLIFMSRRSGKFALYTVTIQ